MNILNLPENILIDLYYLSPHELIKLLNTNLSFKNKCQRFYNLWSELILLDCHEYQELEIIIKPDELYSSWYQSYKKRYKYNRLPSLKRFDLHD
jgi:hypothetical protein